MKYFRKSLAIRILFCTFANRKLDIRFANIFHKTLIMNSIFFRIDKEVELFIDIIWQLANEN